MSLNLILTISLAVLFALFLFLMYRKSKNEKREFSAEDGLTMQKLLGKVQYALADLVREETFSGFDDEEWESLYKRKARIESAMKNCVYGVKSAKTIVKDLIETVVKEELPTREEILQLVDFESSYLDPQIKFEVLLHHYYKQFKNDGLAKMIVQYDLDRERYEIEDKSSPSYLIDENDINTIYRHEVKGLTYEDMITVVSTLIYQRYKGFGIIDTLLEMNINGVNCGASGSILSNSNVNRNLRAPRSVWLNLWGKYIHLRFLNFGTEEELRRVVQLVCRYNSPGPLTEKRGYLVNTMHDKSRVLALRPPASEYWAVFIRRFSLSNATTEGLIIKQLDRKMVYDEEYEAKLDKIPSMTDFLKEKIKLSMETQNIQPEVFRAIMANEINLPGFTGNGFLPIKMYRFLMRGEVTVAFTGRQNSGKTTMMTAVVRYMDPRYTIRVLEMAPEMYLREMYPERNILSLQETEYVSAQKLQDALKKSDAAISIVGEVATDVVAARMIQMGRIASLFTIFSHHANTASDLCYGLRDSLVSAEGMTGEAALNNVLDVIRVNSHSDFTSGGKRFVERFTEIIKLSENMEYPEIDPNNVAYTSALVEREYYRRQTDREKFITVDVMRYNHDNDSYEPRKFFSERLTKHMMERLPAEMRLEFSKFVKTYWMKEGAKGA